jgi:hypothetical protein
MAKRRRRWRMAGMSTPLVIEAPIQLEPVTADTFIADLDAAGEERMRAFLERLAASPRRLIYD